MGKCQACTFAHPHSGGWGPRCTNSQYGADMGHNASTIKVYADDEDCLLTAWSDTHYQGRGLYLNVHNQHILDNINHRQRYHDDNWDNDPQSIRVERIPKANQNQLEYHLPIKRYTPNKPGDNYCGGCRWWPAVKNSGDPKNANRDDVLLKDIDQNQGWNNDYVGKPCPGTTKAYFNSKSGVKCIYDKNNVDFLEVLDRTIKDQGITSDPRQPMYDYLRGETCKVSTNLNKIVTKDQKTCKDWDTSKALAKEWCQKDNNIVDDTLNVCTTEHLGADMYNTLAEAYCKQNPDKDFCKCYNVVNYETVCANRPTSAGCPAAKEAYDKYVKYEIPDPNVWLPCGDACKGVNNYQPPGHDDGCGGTIAACIQKIEVGAAHDEINAACNIDASSGLTTGGSGDSGDASDSSDSGSVSTSAVEELKKTIAEDKKKEEEESKKTQKKLLIGGGAGGILSSISFLMLIVLIIMTMSKKGGGRRR